MAETVENAEAKQTTSEQKRVSKENLEWMLTRVLRLPRIWLTLSIIFILLSVVEISWTRNVGFSFAIHVTAVTPIFLALMWLPALLAIFALVGGAVKTPAGEMSSPGLSNFLQFIDDDGLGVLLEKTAEAKKQGSSVEARENAQQINKQLQEVYVSRIPVTKRRKELENLAREYEELRKQLSPGRERTLEMQSLLGRMQALLPEAHLSTEEVLAYLTSQEDGKRILGLAAALTAPELEYFDASLQMIDSSHSAFEQYRALRLVEALVPNLNRIEREKLRNVLINQRNYDPAQHRWIASGIDRDYISRKILKMIEQMAQNED